MKKGLFTAFVVVALGFPSAAQEPVRRVRTPHGQAIVSSRGQDIMQQQHSGISSAASGQSLRVPMPPRERVDPLVPVATPTAVNATATFNVKDFGAACDGKTDDTTAIQSAYDAAAQAMKTPGGAAIVYFPPSSGLCLVSAIHVPNMTWGQGWLVSEFENGLIISDSFYPGSNTAYIGLTSTGLNNSFLWGPTAVWEKPKWATSPTAVVTLTNVTQVYFEGISIFNNNIFPAVLEQDEGGKGVTNIKWVRSTMLGDYNVIPSSPQNIVGFGLSFEDTTIEGVLNIENFGMMTYRGGYLYRSAISNVGNVNTSDFEFDDVLSEGLNQDFLTIDTSGGTVSDITLHRVRIADPVSGIPVYMVKHINNSGINWDVNVEFDQIPYNVTGAGLIDPSSAPKLFSVVCIGSNCNTIIDKAKSTLYVYMGMAPKSPLIVYGSQYVPNPVVVEH